jgi:uncharacterized membrane-anchored protein
MLLSLSNLRVGHVNDKNNEEEFREILNALEGDSEDCPDELIKLATTPFERVVCIEFYKLYKDFQSFKEESRNDRKWLRWLICGIFAITAFALIIQLIDNFLSHSIG